MNTHSQPTSPIVSSLESIGTGQLPASDRATTVVDILSEHPLVKKAFSRLHEELPANLTYHTVDHTNDVFSRTIELAVIDGLSENDITILAIAAAWHDTGFIVQPQKNEPIAAAWMREAMEHLGCFKTTEIADAEQAILDTQIQFNNETRTLFQISQGRLSPWLLDADLANFGQPDFFQKSMSVYAEMRGKAIESAADLNDDAGRAYIAGAIRLVAGHRWHTSAANNLLNVQKQLNLKGLGLLLGQMIGGAEPTLQQIWERCMAGETE